MTKSRTTPKRAKKTPAKAVRKVYKPVFRHKKRIRNPHVIPPKLSVTQNNLGQMVRNLTAGKKSKMKVQAYEDIAEKLSKIAGLSNGHVWSYNYVSSIHSGAIQPSKKFIDALKLFMQDFNPHKKQWFYFASRNTVACVYNKSIMAEIVKSNMRSMGYRLVTRVRYLQIKKIATRKGR